MAPPEKGSWDRDEENDGEELTGLLRRASRLPLGALAACAMYVPGVVLWAVFAIRTKEDTAAFFNTVAPVSSSTLDAADNAVLTTLITLVVGCSLIFLGALALACARSAQSTGQENDSCCPCAHPSPSSYYLYSIFNLGVNTIVVLVNLAIVFLLMGAFMWLVVAYAANQAIKYGVRDAAELGTSPSAQLVNATRNLTTVVTRYERQMAEAPACISNSTWLSTLNSSVNGILRHPDDDGLQSTILCPYTCLNLGSFATLFKLPYNCICDQEKLETMQDLSSVTSTDAGVALGGLILIYFACCMLHANLTAQFVHSRHDFDEAVRQRRLRGSFGDPEGGDGSKGGGGGGGDGGLPPQPQGRLRRFSNGSRSARSGGGSGGGGGGSRRQVSPQEAGADGAGAAADAALAAAEAPGGAPAAGQAPGSPGGGGGPAFDAAALAASGGHPHRAGSGPASPHAGGSPLPLPLDGGLWPGDDEAAAAAAAAAHPHHAPRHRPMGSAGSARDILLGRATLDAAGSFGGGSARAAAGQQRPGSVSATSSLAARHTPSSSQDSMSADSPQLAAARGAGGAAAWRQAPAKSGSGRWQTIEGLEGGQGGVPGSPGGGEVTSQQQQQQQQQQQHLLWARDSGGAAAEAAALSAPAAAAAVALLGVSDSARPTSPPPLGPVSSMPSPWRPGSSGGLGAHPASAAAAAALAPDGDAAHPRPASALARPPGQPLRHHHSLSASLPLGGTLSEWAEVHDPAPPPPLYSPDLYYGGGGAGGGGGTAGGGYQAPPGSLACTPSSSGGQLAGGMPSVLESGGSTASSDLGRPRSADQQSQGAAAPGAPTSPMHAHAEAERQRGYRSMRKGLMAYDQYKQRPRRRNDGSADSLPPTPQQQQQQQQGVPGDQQPPPPQQQQPVDPRSELCRRYRNRVPAI